jgi:5-formyltetrahydrofolate cyclo-ligase
MNKKSQKQRIRQELLEKRQQMTGTDYLEHSACIISRLKKLDSFKKAGIIHCYVSINERREVNTHPLIKEMLLGTKKVVVPVMQMKEHKLKHIQLDHFEDLQPNRWQILEPHGGEEVPPEQLELILVPMVGGDFHKNRIGYGGGYYDQFLKNADCPSVGLLFDYCLLDQVPVEPFDMPLTKIITQKQIIS